MMNRRHFLGTAAAMMAMPAMADEVSLRALAAKKGILFGCATANYELKDGDFRDALIRDAGILSAEYELKRNAVERARGQFDFAPADALLSFSRDHGMKFRGHALVWYHSNPGWLEDAVASSRDEKLFTDYIARVAGHYRGRMHSWDVVNEIMLLSDGRADGLRNDFWMKAFGPNYIDTAFHAARAADPQALLVYNDWGCEAGEAKNDRIRAATLKFLESAIARRVPIDALGLQGHLSAFGPQVDQAKLRKFLDAVKSLGLRILVTEHDVDDSGGSSDVAARDTAVADASRRFLDVVVSNSATSEILCWGLSDRYIDSGGILRYSPRKLPLDYHMGRKPMWYALEKTFS
ncbi:MAG TPA: endo-1,4-beta-xylanase [Rhizomicrobium sp.]|nr:endo-1,4-beta-xylanase [Rhizomicrobium sp.]